MTKEAFEREILAQLQAQRIRHPAMEREDAVKLIFQAMLGAGHSLSSREEIAARIAREMDGLQAHPEEPLFEALSPAWCRLNLRRAKAERLPPSVIAGMMLASASDMPFTRQDVNDCCKRLALLQEGHFLEDAERSNILDESWLPAHSAAYREKERPAYRVVSAQWLSCLEAVKEISQKCAGANRLLVTLDGPCASGKTTLAQKLALVFQGQTAHTDDFVIPHGQKTPERLAVPGGNCDAERLAKEVAAPFKQGSPVFFQRYDCHADRLLPPEQLPPTQVLILEGSYCNLPPIRAHADVRLFLDVPWEIRKARLLQRESPASMQQFLHRWIPLENAYFEAYHLPDASCTLLRPEEK